MLVNQLPLVVVFRMYLAVTSGERLSRLIGLETQVKPLLTLCLVSFS
jgi:hypothetical protein